MIHTLRRTHRGLALVLALVLPWLLWIAVTRRDPRPAPDRSTPPDEPRMAVPEAR